MTCAPTLPGNFCMPPAHARQRDRRSGLDGLLASLTPALRRSGAQLRPIFEEVTRRLVSAEHLRLVDAPAGFVPIGAASGARAITVPVPADGPAGAMMLEAVSAPGRSFEPWELQVLHGAGLVAALLLEIERARQSLRAQQMHSTYLASKEKTCIDCHKGIAHRLPYIPPGESPTDTPGQAVPKAGSHSFAPPAGADAGAAAPLKP